MQRKVLQVSSVSEKRVPINSDADIVTARQLGRSMAAELGFTAVELTLIATAISELARNIILYAQNGEIVLRPLCNGDSQGIAAIARDQGPGMANLKQSLLMGFSTSGSLGLGLPGVRRLMDEFDIKSEPGWGTTVTVKKWKR